ncbi:MAG: hypothetical protein C5B59_12815 [Bacteroidetes bacterium]|nr:MAG: hypothetical protein C5B59_12815 [Bacteroidota bacterium]
MATQLYRVPTQNNLQTTLNAQMAQGASTCILATDLSGVVRLPGIFVVDRVDASGNKTPNAREYISFTGQSGTTLSGLTKGLGGSTDQLHNVGAIVEFVPDVVWEDAMHQVITHEHDVYGQHISLASLYVANTLNLAVPSNASIQREDVQNSFVHNALNTSGASLQGFQIRPVWALPGGASGPSVPMGVPLVMTDPGTISWISAVAQGPASQASLALTIRKNGVDILANSYLFMIPMNGTYISLASIATNTFNQGDVFTVGTSTASSMARDITIQMYAR